jgi:hypothetical protein
MGMWIDSLTIVNSAAINMSVQVSLLHADLHSFDYLPQKGVV